MADQKNLLQQVPQKMAQVWDKVAPTLRSLLVKFLDASIPSLERLSHQISQDASPSSNQFLAIGRSLFGKLTTGLLGILTNLRQQMPPLDPTTDPNQPLFPEPVQTELNTAWGFVQQRLVPVIINFLTKTVEWLDPKVSSIWQAATTNVTVVKLGNQVQQNSNWQKASTAIAPVGRSISQIFASIQVPAVLQPILQKRAAVTTIGILLFLILWLKPSHDGGAIAKNVSLKSVPKVAKQLDDFLPPEQGDTSISPEQIMVTDIQSQVADATNRYGEALIQSVQTNFKLGRLVIQLTDAWYQLTPNKQEQLIDDLLERSQSLKFNKLLIADADRHLIARSPVVGREMVILRR